MSMFFKQLAFYPLQKLPTEAELKEALSECTFSPCQGLDWFSEGYSSPVAFADSLVFTANSTLCVALLKEEKVLPSSVITKQVDEKITLIEKEEVRQVGRKEKQALREQITDNLLPRAFVRQSLIRAIFDPMHSYLLINNASPIKAEGMLSKLRQALGGLQASLVRTKTTPSALMTDWLLAGEAGGNFELDSSCLLSGTGDSAPSVRINRQNLTADEVTNHIKNGKTVDQLGLIWKNNIRFVLTRDFTLLRIQFLDMLQEEANQNADDMPSLMQASQMIMTENLGSLLDELVTLLNGFE